MKKMFAVFLSYCFIFFLTGNAQNPLTIMQQMRFTLVAGEPFDASDLNTPYALCMSDRFVSRAMNIGYLFRLFGHEYMGNKINVDSVLQQSLTKLNQLTEGHRRSLNWGPIRFISLPEYDYCVEMGLFSKRLKSRVRSLGSFHGNRIILISTYIYPSCAEF